MPPVLLRGAVRTRPTRRDSRRAGTPLRGPRSLRPDRLDQFAKRVALLWVAGYVAVEIDGCGA